jgi:hypothetical protein
MPRSAGTPSLSDLDLAFRTLLSDVLSGKDRNQIAAEMTKRLGLRENPINRSKLNDFTATTKAGARFPAIYVPALCEAAGDDRLRYFLQTPRVQLLVDIGSKVVGALADHNARLVFEADPALSDALNRLLAHRLAHRN